MTELCAMTQEELKNWLAEHGQPSFHADQILDWVYQKGVGSWELMTNLSKDLRARLASEISFPSLHRVSVTDSDDGETYKSLWKLADGSLVESVLICSDRRRTVCVSSQVGCPARCAFCASGKEGLLRQLTAGEIVEQVWQTNAELSKKGERVTHIVFMGMGEPLENYENVVKAIRIFIDPRMFNISQRRITVSTVGVVDGIHRLAAEEWKVNLVLSLHAPNQKIRQKIIPYARKYPLEDVLEAMDTYAELTKRDITFEYTLLSGINDQPEHAAELAELVGSKQCTVNLIPYNPVLGMRLKRPSREVINAFRDVLDNANIVNTCRYTKGDDIAAACGQLALQTLASKLPMSPIPVAPVELMSC